MGIWLIFMMTTVNNFSEWMTLPIDFFYKFHKINLIHNYTNKRVIR